MNNDNLFVIQVVNGETVNHPLTYSNFLLLFPDCEQQETPTNEVIKPYGYEVFVITPKPINGPFEHPAVEGPYVKNNDVWTNSWTITPFTEEEILDKKWKQIRGNRNFLLRQTDWTQLLNVNITTEEKQLWDQYRQTLRDIPQTFTDPDKVTIPTVPADNSIFRQVFET